MGRRPYRTTMRPFRDSDTEVTVHWYKVPASNPKLPYPSRINSLDWRDFGINPGPVGEVTGAEREFDGWGRIVPPLPGDHICGTREDFEFGGSIGGPGPPLVRDPDGIPTCCRDAIKGLLLGGEMHVIYPDPLPAGAILLGASVSGEGDEHGYTFLGVGWSARFETVSSRVPLDVCQRWDSLAGAILLSTAPRGTVGSWTLTGPGGTMVYENTSWDGIVVFGSPIPFTRVSGPGPTVCYAWSMF